MPDEQPQISLATARAVALAIIFSMCAMTTLGALIAVGMLDMGPPPVDEARGRVLRLVFLAVGFATIGMSHVVRSVFDKRAAASADPLRGRYTAVVVAMALGETPATLALVNGILTHHTMTTVALGAAAIITGLSHFPRMRTFE